MEKLFNNKICHICRKEFIVQDCGQYIFKKQEGKNLRYFCSWSCYRKYLKKKGID